VRGVAGQRPQQVDGVATQSGVDRDRRFLHQALDPLGGDHRQPVGHLDEVLERLTRGDRDRRHPAQHRLLPHAGVPRYFSTWKAFR
jgi:hypothetical protein